MARPAVTKVGGAVVRSIVMSLCYMGAVAGVSAVLWRVSPRLGSLVLLGCSCLFMLKSYRREWRLGWVTCTLPLAAALGCYLIQAIALPTRPSPGFFGSAVLVGAAIGLLRGRGHRVSVRNGRVFAQRTLLYLLVWFGCIFATHGFAVFGLPRPANLGLIGGAFSTAAFVMVSLVLLFKYFSACRTHAKSDGASAAGKVFALLAMAVFLTWPGRARANRMVDSFPLKYGSRIFSGSPFDSRLPTDDEIKQAVDSAMDRFRDEKFTATDLWVFEELHQERTVCEDAATRKFHKRNAVDPVKSSYLVVLFTQKEHVTRLVAAPPGFEGDQGYEDAEVVSYCCAWLMERNGRFEFSTSTLSRLIM